LSTDPQHNQEVTTYITPVVRVLSHIYGNTELTRNYRCIQVHVLLVFDPIHAVLLGLRRVCLLELYLPPFDHPPGQRSREGCTLVRDVACDSSISDRITLYPLKPAPIYKAAQDQRTTIQAGVRHHRSLDVCSRQRRWLRSRLSYHGLCCVRSVQSGQLLHVYVRSLHCPEPTCSAFCQVDPLSPCCFTSPDWTAEVSIPFHAPRIASLRFSGFTASGRPSLKSYRCFPSALLPCSALPETPNAQVERVILILEWCVKPLSRWGGLKQS
jgi:hypothetical protein